MGKEKGKILLSDFSARALRTTGIYTEESNQWEFPIVTMISTSFDLL